MTVQICVCLPHEVVVEVLAIRIGKDVDGKRDEEQRDPDHRRVDAREQALEPAIGEGDTLATGVPRPSRSAASPGAVAILPATLILSLEAGRR